MYHIHFTLKWHYVDHSWTTQISKVVNSTNWKIWQKFWKLSAWNMRTQGNSNILQWLMPPQKNGARMERGGSKFWPREEKQACKHWVEATQVFETLLCQPHFFASCLHIWVVPYGLQQNHSISTFRCKCFWNPTRIQILEKAFLDFFGFHAISLQPNFRGLFWFSVRPVSNLTRMSNYKLMFPYLHFSEFVPSKGHCKLWFWKVQHEFQYWNYPYNLTLQLCYLYNEKLDCILKVSLRVVNCLIDSESFLHGPSFYKVLSSIGKGLSTYYVSLKMCFFLQWIGRGGVGPMLTKAGEGGSGV